VRYTARVANNDAYLCHCRMCQRATGGVSIAFKQVKVADVQWHGEPDWFDSSPIAERPFCSNCGSPLGFRFKEGSDKMDLTVGSFDEPFGFVPKWHFGAERIHRDWLNTEGLPEHRTEDHEVLVKKWVDAIGKVPE
jgi:hypothetical protein